MYILTYKVSSSLVDEKIELLQLKDIFNVYYESPLEITTDEYGYGYSEKDNEEIHLKVAFDGKKEELSDFQKIVTKTINLPLLSTEENNYDYSTYNFPAVHIDEKWVLASPEEEIVDKTKINFVSLGAFGTGIHETTQDILKLILNKLSIENKSILDIGTGSGILAIASSIAKASSVTAVDIRDVKDEVELNSSLNNLTNINVLVGDLLTGEIVANENYDWIYINIGGEETALFMDYINQHLDSNGSLLVSGLVEWSFPKVKNIVESYNFVLKEKHQTKEWVTAVFTRN